MRKLLSLGVILLLATGSFQTVSAQSLLERAAQKAKEKITNKTEEKVDNAVDKGINAIGGLLKKNGKKSKDNEESVTAAETATTAMQQKKTTRIAWNNYDFVAGDEIIFEDTQEGEKLGEFPSMWDAFHGNAEIVNIAGANCINLQDASITPLFNDGKTYLTDMFTIEFDVCLRNYHEIPGLGGNELNVNLGLLDNIQMVDYNHNSALHFLFEVSDFDDYGESSPYVRRELGISYSWATGTNDEPDREGNYVLKDVATEAWHHIAISFNKRAYKVYFDEQRVINIPNARPAKYLQIAGGGDYERLYFIKNVRIAKGAVPLYDRLASDGKIVTYGITFDTGKATIKPESMGEINRIKDIMDKDASLKFEVQGHCDNTGSDAVNDKLSQQRAEAIVARLVELGISSDRLNAVGKGSHAPISDNATDEGRAKNRRVEFVKK